MVLTHTMSSYIQIPKRTRTHTHNVHMPARTDARARLQTLSVAVTQPVRHTIVNDPGQSDTVTRSLMNKPLRATPKSWHRFGP